MITVIIPAKNEEKNLPELLESLKKQNYHKKFELLLVDGKSNDRTREVAESYGCRVVIQKKLGISNARNLGWKLAKGDLLVFLEADQKVDKNMLKEVEETFSKKEVKCARANYIPVKGNWIQKALSVQIELATRRQKSLEFPTIFRKEVLRKTRGWDERIDFAEDRELPSRIKKLRYETVLIKNAVVYAKPVDSLSKLYKQGRWYGRNIFGYFGKTKDFVTLFGVFVYSFFFPLMILSFVHQIFLTLFALDLLVLILYSLQGLIIEKSYYAILMIPINVVRGFGELIGMIESLFRKTEGKV
jgi:cellulose synthase/poly-beta-1,6-N-acetylglucosamine synthase-like glycosyltransferase